MATALVAQMLTAPAGMNLGLGSLSAPDSNLAQPIDLKQVYTQNVGTDVTARSIVTRYPSVYIYCNKIANTLKEKFRSFSGNAQMIVELRHSQDRLEGLQNALELYIDSVTQVLDQSRGDWGNGMYYTGGYEVALAPVKSGGKNFIQTGTITFQVQVSRN
ncbi:MAG: hypothetical protein JO323_02280 [Acidobacteriia bacterium]|nr:hypothetical protein [Terriglobia bacterium]